MRKSLAAAIAAALLLSACTDDGAEVGFDDLPSESPSTEPTDTASAEAPSDEIDVTTTPDEITPEWVTAVVNTIYDQYGQITAEVLALPLAVQPALPEGVEDRLSELFTAQYLERRRAELLLYSVDQDARDELYAPADIGGLRFETQLVQFTEPGCVVAVGRLSQAETMIGGGELPYLSAVSLSPNSSPSDLNPTPWRIADELINTNPQGEANADDVMLNASLEDYGSALDNTCGGAS